MTAAKTPRITIGTVIALIGAGTLWACQTTPTPGPNQPTAETSFACTTARDYQRFNEDFTKLTRQATTANATSINLEALTAATSNWITLAEQLADTPPASQQNANVRASCLSLAAAARMTATYIPDTAENAPQNSLSLALDLAQQADSACTAARTSDTGVTAVSACANAKALMAIIPAREALNNLLAGYNKGPAQTTVDDWRALTNAVRAYTAAVEPWPQLIDDLTALTTQGDNTAPALATLLSPTLPTACDAKHIMGAMEAWRRHVGPDERPQKNAYNREVSLAMRTIQTAMGWPLPAGQETACDSVDPAENYACRDAVDQTIFHQCEVWINARQAAQTTTTP